MRMIGFADCYRMPSDVLARSSVCCKAVKSSEMVLFFNAASTLRSEDDTRDGLMD